MPEDNENPTPENEKPKEGLENLRPFMEGAGVEVPADLKKSTPYLYINAPVDEMANSVADFLRGKHLLFRRGREEIVTIDEDTGHQRVMTPNRLRTWLPDTAGLIPVIKFDKESGKPIKGELDTKQTSGILSCDALLFKLPSIEAVNPVPIPVFSDELDERDDPKRRGFKKLQLSPFGYHAPTKSYTIHGGLQYDEDMDPNEAVRFFRNLFRYFPMDDRSTAVHLSAMLSVFCRRIYVGRTPMFLYNSNLGGSGKSKLAECAVMPVHGRPGSTSYDQFQQKDVKSDLDSIANTYKPYVLFDDFELPGDTQLRSNHLNRWLTADVWESRTYGKNTERRDIPLEAVTLMTGIKFNLEGQLRRRTLFIDLFAKQKASERVLPEDAVLITTSFMRDPERRKQLLSAMWAMVRWWDDHGRNGTGTRPLESFEDWSAVVPGIVFNCGFANALEKFEAADAGDIEGAELAELVRLLIKENLVDKGLTRATVMMVDIIRTARKNELFEAKLWSLEQVMNELENKRFKWRTTDREGNPLDDGHGGEKTEDELTREDKLEQAAEWQNAAIGSKWGKYFKKLVTAGQYFECDGRWWQFGSRDKTRGSKYEITLLEDTK